LRRHANLWRSALDQTSRSPGAVGKEQDPEIKGRYDSGGRGDYAL
jgi:hypothetical protein